MSAPNQMHADHNPDEGFSDEGLSGEDFSEENIPYAEDDLQGRTIKASREGRSEEWLDEARREVEQRKARTAQLRQQSRPQEFIERDKRSQARQSATGGETDEELFRRFQHGDQRAFLIIYDRYKRNIYSYCAKILMGVGMTTEQVEDAYQDVFLRLTQYQHTFIGGDFKPWIFTVARHSCLSAKKKAMQTRIRTEYVGDAENLDEDTTNEVRAALSRTDDPLERMSHTEQLDLLRRAIAALPDTYREALILSDYEGMTYDEIGKMTGTSLSTIRIRVFRAKARLRKVLLPIIGDQVDGLVPLPDAPPED